MNKRGDAVSVRLPFWTKLGYGTGNVANGIVAQSIGFWLLIFYTDIVGLNPAWVSYALFAGRLWDAFTDPAMGYISDRTRSPFGRRRPYIVSGAPLFAAAFVLMWWVPLEQSAHVVFVYLLLVNLFLTTMQTVVTVPYLALGAELTMDYHERNAVMAYQQAGVVIGSLIGVSLLNFSSLVGAFLDPEAQLKGIKEIIGAFFSATKYEYMQGAGFRWTVLAFAPVIVLSLFLVAKATRENPHFQRRSTIPAMKLLFATFRNRPFRIYIGAFLIGTTTWMIGGFMLPLLLIHWLQKPAYVMPGFVITLSATSVGLPLWRALGQRLEKKHCYMVSLSMGIIVTMLFLVFVTPEWPPGVLIWSALVGLVAGGAAVYAPSMLADIIDSDESESGLRQEGAFTGVTNFITKCAGSLGALWVGPGLALAGYDGQADAQSDRTLLIMRLLYVCPAVLNIFAVLVLSRFPLTSKVMDEVHRTINARARQSGDRTV